MKKINFIFFTAFLLIALNSAFSQSVLNRDPSSVNSPFGESSNGKYMGEAKTSNELPKDAEIVNQIEITPELSELISKQKTLRKEGNMNEVIKIQEKINKLTGIVSNQGENFRTAPPPLETDFVVARSYIKGMTFLQAYATASEQIGANIGRVWVTVGGANTGSNDSAFIYFTDNGFDWNLWAAYSFNEDDIINKNEIDCEIIESTFGVKYLYIVYGIFNYTTGKNSVKMSVTNITASEPTSVFDLNWPGTFSTTKFKKPKITSDNAQWQTNPYIYISASVDSSSGGSTRKAGTKIAQIFFPNSLTPTIYYKPTPLAIIYSYSSETPDNYSDLAYYYDEIAGEESVMFVESNLGFNTSLLYRSRARVSDFLISIYILPSIAWNSNQRTGATIISKGYFHLLSITCKAMAGSNGIIERYEIGTFSSYITHSSESSDVSLPDFVKLRNEPEIFHPNFGSNIAFADIDSTNCFTSLVSNAGAWSNDKPVSKSIFPKAGVTLNNEIGYYCLWTNAFNAGPLNKYLYFAFTPYTTILATDNFEFTGPNELQFDLLIKQKHNLPDLQLIGGYFNFLIDTSIANGGALSFSLVTDEMSNVVSDLPQDFFDPAYDLHTTNYNSFKRLNCFFTGDIAAAEGYPIPVSTSPPLRICRFKVRTSATDFAALDPELSWNVSTRLYDRNVSGIAGYYNSKFDLAPISFHYTELRMSLEGMTSSAALSSGFNGISDTVKYYLRYSQFPYALADSSKTVLWSSGISRPGFRNAYDGTEYYLTIKQRNSIETWSKFPIVYNDSISYDFTTSASQAYGDNLKELNTAQGTVYAIYSGDVNQDGSINLADVILINNDANVFATGYLKTDVNGNNITDLTDVLIAYNNSTNFVTVVKP